MYYLNKEQLELQKFTRTMSIEKLEKGERERSENRIFPHKIMEELSQDGYMKIFLEDKYKGLELDFLESVVIINEISKVDSSIGHLIAGVNYGVNYPIMEFGTKEQKDKYLGENGDGLNIGLLAFNEPNGAGVGQISTVAEKQGDYYIISGTKSMITNANYANYGLIFTQIMGSLHNYTMFIVDLKDNPSIQISQPENTMGLHSVHIADIHFDNLKVHKSAILGKEGNGFEVLCKSMDLMRLGNAVVSLGIAERAYIEIFKFVKQRKISQVPMGNYQAIQFKLADIKARLAIMNMAVYTATDNYQKNQNTSANDTSIVKYFVTESAKFICDQCLQLFGGMGYISEFVIERLYRDIRIMTIIGGTSETILEGIAREILD